MNRVLVIEDDTTALRQVAQLFAFEGFEVDQAGSGVDGIAHALKHPPDLIVCDIMMPGTDGFGVLQALRCRQETSLIPFIFLTAKAGAHDVRQGMGEGADDYITKPFEPGALLHSARQRLSRRCAQLEEAKSMATKAGMLAAAIIPQEMERSLGHIERLCDAMAFEYRGDRQLSEMRAAIGSELESLRRMSARLSLYAELPRLYAGRFSQQLAPSIQCSPDALRRASESAARDHGRSEDLSIECSGERVPMQEQAAALIAYELVSNACKFSPAGTPVRVSASCESALWRLAVSDEGPGMSGTQIAEVAAFKQFWSGTERPAGLGLGLSLVQMLVRLQSGEFSIESQAERGTRVFVMLPAE